MNQQDIITALKQNKKFLSDNFGVESIGLFGSYSRNEQQEGSDIDVLVKLKNPQLHLLVGVLDFLEKSFSKKVDVVTDGTQLSERFRRRIKSEIIYV